MSSHPRLVAILVIAALLLAACSGDGGSPEGATSTDDVTSSGEAGADVDVAATGPARGGSLTVLIQEDPAPILGWTPWDHVCAWACRNVLDQVLEHLAVVLPDGSVEPWLAESITPNDDLTEWTVVLREGVAFSDGAALSAAGVKAGHDEFLKDGKATEGLLRDARVVGLEVRDDRTLVYELSEPNAGLPMLLTGPVGRVFSVEAARTDPAGFLRAPIGSGPFVFRSWEVGADVVLAANPSYWRTDAEGVRLPYAGELRFVQIADEADRLERLRAGGGQVMQTRAPLTVQQARELQLTVIAPIEDNVGAVVFNTLEPPFDDPRVRQGLLLASDQQALLAAGGVADVSPPATQWWGPESVWWSDRVAETWPSTDVDEARRLLGDYVDDGARSDELETGEPIQVRLQCTDDLQLSNMMRELAVQWEATGVVDVTVETVSRNGLIQRVVGSITDRPSFSGDFTASCWRLGGESDPWALLVAALGPVKTSPLNISNLETSSLEDLVVLLQEGATDAARRAALEQIMLSFASDVPAIYLGHAVTAVVSTPEVEGLGVWTLPGGQQVLGQFGGVGRYDEVWIG